MAEKTIYSGPGKVYLNSIALQPEGENGPINLAFTETTTPVAASMFGRIGEQVADQFVDLSVKPFDSWGNLRTLFPAYLGVTVGASAGVLAIGTRPHGATNSPTVVWSPDGRLYNIVRTAIVGHPALTLGIGQAMFGDVRIVGVGDGVTPVAMGASGFLIAGNAITESGGADPGGAFAMTDFIRGAWVGAFGAVTGFTDIEAETAWTIENSISYSPLMVQGRTRGFKLDSVSFMAKCRPFGPTQTQILGRIGGHTHGQRLGSADLVLTGPSSKTITLKNAELKGGGFEFGGTTLGNGEIGFVNEMTFSTGAPQPLLVFSA